MISLIDSEQISQETLIWTGGMANWKKVSEFESSSHLPESGSDPAPPDISSYIIETIKPKDNSTTRRAGIGSSDLLDDIIDDAEQEIEYASIGNRFLAMILDSLIIMVLDFILLLSISLIVRQMEENKEIVILIYYILLIVLNVSYYAYFETSKFQATFGKQALRIIVTDDNGNRLTVSKSIGRYFAKFLSSFLLIGYFIAFINPERKTLHDSLAGTIVINKF